MTRYKIIYFEQGSLIRRKYSNKIYTKRQSMKIVNNSKKPRLFKLIPLNKVNRRRQLLKGLDAFGGYDKSYVFPRY